MLILVSSGVVQTNIDNPDWIKTLLKDIHTDVPENIADIIISQAKTNSEKKIRNDMSVLVLKFRFK
jgi:serine phosphatase RsbU (regulator of sigma subunit)